MTHKREGVRTIHKRDQKNGNLIGVSERGGEYRKANALDFGYIDYFQSESNMRPIKPESSAKGKIHWFISEWH